MIGKDFLARNVITDNGLIVTKPIVTQARFTSDRLLDGCDHQ